MKKVLVIEDDAPLCWLLGKILNRKYEVMVMNSGMEAWSWLTDGNSPDLIITDLNMPAMDGVELLEYVSNSGLFRNIPVMILSGDDDPVKRLQCLELGAYAYLVKPFEPQAFLREVERALTLPEQTIAVNH
jgi:two-component system chemotaxis response regulator CheY